MQHSTLSLTAPFDQAILKVTEALADEGFGVITRIDMHETFKAKLGVDFPSYTILGACNPNMAWEAIGLEPKVGSMLPCNVIVREVDNGVEVSAIDPQASMAAIDNENLKRVAGEVRELLRKAVDSI